ncbi:MAG: ubiquinol-cytochrome C chaperone family protein [Magnetococcales bacterium]|nr:ubiquinol-cytochrome C chaperone family protein [Magnetococcales bacterium]
MSRLSRISPKKWWTFLAHMGGSWARSADKRRQTRALRAQVQIWHDRIVDRVLQVTANGHLDLADTFSLRFDVMVFLVSAVLRHLHRIEGSQESSQMLWDITFAGLEESLYARGVSDLRMAKRMRTVLQNATGRRDAYLAAWADPASPEAIRVVIARNVFNGTASTDPRIDILLGNLPGFAASVLEPPKPIATTVKQGDTA